MSWVYCSAFQIWITGIPAGSSPRWAITIRLVTVSTSRAGYGTAVVRRWPVVQATLLSPSERAPFQPSPYEPANKRKVEHFFRTLPGVHRPGSTPRRAGGR